MNISNSAIVLAYNKGYRVDALGRLVSPSGVLRKCLTNNKGYFVFTQRYGKRKDNKMATIPVHRLAAYQKFGEAVFDEGIVVRHFNDDPKDNSPDNIFIGSQQQNMLDRDPKTRKQHATHAASFKRKFTDREETEIKEFYSNCRSYKMTMSLFEIPSKGSLFYILHKSRTLNPC